MHEYVGNGWLDPGCRHIGGVLAEARVLPWVECPGAGASASQLAGRSVADLRAEVRAEFGAIAEFITARQW